MNEVRFDRMIPAQLVARREACNLAYLPVGALEWHGAHMPFGTDFLIVQRLAEEAARRFGGVVFPPIYYHDVRYQLHDCRPEWHRTYTELLQVPEAFTAFPLCDEEGRPELECPVTLPEDGPQPAEALPFDHDGQWREFTRHIATVLLEIHLYGFRNILLLPGHGPNFRICPEAEEVYRQNVARRSALGPPARTLSFNYFSNLDEPRYGQHWLHADALEGSLTMAAVPGTVHLDRLPDDPEAIPPAYLGYPYLNETDGYSPEYAELRDSFAYFDPRNANADYGRRQLEHVLGKIGEQVAEWMGVSSAD
ncbi:MAG: creatininase family protein [Armatimonadota bacterium]